MATYPTDATSSITAFPVTSTIKYTNTGSATVFNLSSPVSFTGEVAAIIDGIMQATSSYSLSNGGASLTFAASPNASNLTLQTLSIPAKLKQTRSTFTTLAVEYSNSTTIVNDGNAYLVDASTESFALPAGSNVLTTSEFQVFLSGVYQQADAYTYPSATLGNQGIDIGDNSSVKLLQNFFDATTDESPSSHTVQDIDTITYTDFGADTFATFDGAADRLVLPASSDFDLRDKSFTYDTWIRPDTGTSMAANQTLFASYLDGNNFYALRLVGANSNVGFLYKTSNSEIQLYGGNCNGGSNYHVAVSSDINNNNIRLYVNNVLVDHGAFSVDTGFTSNAIIGANVKTGAEFLNGSISFARLAHNSRYRSAGLEPITTTNALSVISAAPLGSIDATDSLSIRVFDSATETIDRFTSMADRKPDKGIGSSRTFETINFASQAGYEKRRLKTRRSKRSYELKYSAITGVEKTAIENFYIARSGEFESFNFDLSHINESGTIITRFSGPLSIDQTYSNGSRLIDNFYTVSFTLQEVFD
jgi:hypothetical protein